MDKDLESQIEDLEYEVEDLRCQLDDANQEISDLESEIEESKEDLDELREIYPLPRMSELSINDVYNIKNMLVAYYREHGIHYDE